MGELKNITTSTFSFPDIIANNFVYVDKTAYLHELLKDGKNLYFLALAAKSPTGKMVLLLDEYDKALLGRLGTNEVTVFKHALKEFHSVVKTREKFQRFVSDPRGAFKIGRAFDWEARDLGRWLVTDVIDETKGTI